MKHVLKLILAILFLSVPSYAQYIKAQGFCEQGNQTVTTSGVTSSTRVQRSHPSCTVTVYNTGTSTLSTLYSTSAGTAKSNPFTAATTGIWFFFAAPATYDVRFSGGGITTPFTMGGWTLPGTGGSTETISNKTLDNTNVITVKDANLTIQNTTDITKQFKFSAASIGASTTRTITVPNSNITLPIFTQSITLTGPTAARSYAIADSNVTIADTTTVQTLTNKTLTSPTINTPLIADPNITTGTIASPTITNPTVTTGTFATPNLTSPTITTDARPAAAGVGTIGTAALPFESIYLGTAITNNIRIDPAATSGPITAGVADPGIAAVTLPLVVRGNATFTAAAIAANACGTDVTSAVSGLATTAVLMVSLAAAPDATTDNGLVWYYWPSVNTVNIRVCNPTAGSLTPAANLVFRYLAVLP